MTESQFKAFDLFRREFRGKVQEWSVCADMLRPLQKAASQKDTPAYPLETAVVYNKALDEFTVHDSIRLIVIGDNPGKDEQLEKNNKYLVGQSGKIAEGFFRRNPELETDFRKNVIILNKTPIHTAKTAHLKYLEKADPRIAQLILESQLWMAENTANLHKTLAVSSGTQLWLVGYAELKGKGIFLPYRDELKKQYAAGTEAWNNVYVYQHFSMNRFLIDLRTYQNSHPGMPLADALAGLGRMHRDEIFAEK